MSNNQQEENSPQSMEGSGESAIESSQEPRVNKRSKLRKASKRKVLKTSKNVVEDGGAASAVSEAVTEEVIATVLPGNCGLEGADLQPGDESDGSSAGTEPYEGETENHGVQVHGVVHQENPKEYSLSKDIEDVVSEEVANLERDESVEEVQEVVASVSESNGLEDAEEDADDDSNHGGQVDDVKMLRLYELLKEAIEEQEGAEVANQFTRLGLERASKQRSVNPFDLAASLPRFEPGQAIEVTTRKGSEEVTTISVGVLHRVASELKGLGLHQSSSLQPPAWVALVKQRGRPSKCSTPVLIAPISTRLPRRAKTEALAKQLATSVHEKDMRRTATTSTYDFVDNDEHDFVDGPPPFKAPRFKFLKKDKEEAELEKAKKDSLFDNLRDSRGTSSSRSGSNNDVVGNILQENNLHLPVLPGLNISLVKSPSVNLSTSRKKSEDDEVQILSSESINQKRESEAGTSLSTSSNFRGSCPLCSRVFECHILLETHASSCDGHPATSQV